MTMRRTCAAKLDAVSKANRINRANMLALVEHETSSDAVRFAHHILRVGISTDAVRFAHHILWAAISSDAVRFAHHILPAAVTPACAGTSLRGAQRRGNPDELAQSEPWIASLRSQ
jgi:hypothetical protein